jgi:hypothetical protein
LVGKEFLSGDSVGRLRTFEFAIKDGNPLKIFVREVTVTLCCPPRLAVRSRMPNESDEKIGARDKVLQKSSHQ